jgi:uncharacterized membrane protein
MPNENEEPPRPPRRSLWDFLAARSVVDLMILSLTFVVVFAILATGASVAIIEIVHPESDTTGVVDGLMTIVTGIVGALLGLIAGRNEPPSAPPPAPPP